MPAPYSHIADLAASEVPRDGILSRTLYDGADAKVILFGFDAGQELSEHTSSRPAVMHFVRGEAAVTVGGDALAATPGTWIRMAAGTAHSVRAQSPLVMLLTLLPAEEDAHG
ncbi:MAG: cupin domain-containing protein [Chloroflexi bacterium]|nr:cupin domain-containing protein [Chloroflexota bacterium]